MHASATLMYLSLINMFMDSIDIHTMVVSLSSDEAIKM